MSFPTRRAPFSSGFSYEVDAGYDGVECVYLVAFSYLPGLSPILQRLSQMGQVSGVILKIEVSRVVATHPFQIFHVRWVRVLPERPDAAFI